MTTLAGPMPPGSASSRRKLPGSVCSTPPRLCFPRATPMFG